MNSSPSQLNGLTLIQTKLAIPHPRSTQVSRPRLLRKLDQVLAYRLGLISGPAGTGKSALLAENG